MFVRNCLMMLLLIVAPAVLSAEDWCQWLGPKADAIWREKGILKKFPEGGPQVVWRKPVAAGFSSPSVAQGRVIVTDFVVKTGQNTATGTTRDQQSGVERVLCLDEKSGDLLWKHEYECDYNISYGSGPRSMPTVDENRVYSIGAVGEMKCLALDSGEVLWEADFKKYNGRPAHWGACTHPLIYKNLVICIVGGEGSIAVAFDKMTGKEVWKNLSSKDTGYSSPVLIHAGGVDQVVIWCGDTINGLNPVTGELYWSHPLKTIYGLGIMTPRFSENKLFAGGIVNASALLELDKEKPEAKVLWRGSNRLGLTPSQGIPFMEKGHFYGVNNNGEFHCVENETGKRVWSSFQPTTGERPGKDRTLYIVKHEDRFFLFNDKGDLIIANLSPVGYEEIDRTHIIEPTLVAQGSPAIWCHPSFANQCLYVRNDQELLCISLAAE